MVSLLSAFSAWTKWANTPIQTVPTEQVWVQPETPRFQRPLRLHRQMARSIHCQMTAHWCEQNILSFLETRQRQSCAFKLDESQFCPSDWTQHPWMSSHQSQFQPRPDLNVQTLEVTGILQDVTGCGSGFIYVSQSYEYLAGHCT